MMRGSVHLLMMAALAIGAGCADSPNAPGGDAGTDGGAGVDLAGVDLAGVDFAGVDFAGVDLAGAADGLRATDLATVDTGGPCPNLVGSYSLSATGQGCGDLNVNAPQCILDVSSSCVAEFRSTAAGQLGAIVGTAMLQPDGSFSGADLQLGTVNRTGCTGTWDTSTSTLVVDCGGVGTSQSCIVTLTRTATSCP
jgi:uncharacterized protein YjbI with pentapeptide repeats